MFVEIAFVEPFCWFLPTVLHMEKQITPYFLYFEKQVVKSFVKKIDARLLFS